MEKILTDKIFEQHEQKGGVIAVAVVGMVASGKTTLIGKLRESLEARGLTVHVVEELTRLTTMMLQHRASGELSESFVQRGFLLNGTRQFIKAFRSNVDVVLFDRALFEHTAFAMFYQDGFPSQFEFLFTLSEILEVSRDCPMDGAIYLDGLSPDAILGRILERGRDFEVKFWTLAKIERMLKLYAELFGVGGQVEDGILGSWFWRESTGKFD